MLHIFKSNWEKLKENMDKTSVKIKQMDENGTTIHKN